MKIVIKVSVVPIGIHTVESIDNKFTFSNI